MTDQTQLPIFSVSDLIASLNQTLEYAYPSVIVEGEVMSFKVNQGKYVFFDLKDASGSINCFMTVWQLRMPIEDGMKVIINAVPKITPWGKFSLTVQAIRPSGEGSLKKSFELLKAKLDKEGLFATERKRQLPEIPQYVGVISSTQAAGYADFVKILNDRWGGVRVDVAHTQVQGADAPDQIIRAIQYFNQLETLPEVLIIIRGGGSADDLSAFNDEQLVRTIAASRIPTLTGIGHEVDESLSDLAADVRAATPSNAAQLLVPDKRELYARTQHAVRSIVPRVERAMADRRAYVRSRLEDAMSSIETAHDQRKQRLDALQRVLAELNPDRVLDRGYALIRGQISPGSSLEITTATQQITAEVTNVQTR